MNRNQGQKMNKESKIKFQVVKMALAHVQSPLPLNFEPSKRISNLCEQLGPDEI